MVSRPHRRLGKPYVAGGDNHKRQRIATEAARIMAEEGVDDFQTAKRKAATRLGVAQARNLPDNEEVQLALSKHLKLFHGTKLLHNTAHLREIAVEAMNFLARFEPRLVGPVLAGTVTAGSVIELHVSADSPEQVGLFLREHHIPFRLGEHRMRFGGERYEKVSTYTFTAAGAAIELHVFNPRTVREAPLSPVDGRPMQRAAVRDVKTLLKGIKQQACLTSARKL